MGAQGVLSLMLVMLGLTFFSTNMWTGGAWAPGWCSMTSSRRYLIGGALLGSTACLGYIGASSRSLYPSAGPLLLWGEGSGCLRCCLGSASQLVRRRRGNVALPVQKAIGIDAFFDRYFWHSDGDRLLQDLRLDGAELCGHAGHCTARRLLDRW